MLNFFKRRLKRIWMALSIKGWKHYGVYAIQSCGSMLFNNYSMSIHIWIWDDTDSQRTELAIIISNIIRKVKISGNNCFIKNAPQKKRTKLKSETRMPPKSAILQHGIITPVPYGLFNENSGIALSNTIEQNSTIRIRNETKRNGANERKSKRNATRNPKRNAAETKCNVTQHCESKRKRNESNP